MARGWESKSVESQIESAERRRGTPTVHLSPEQIEHQRQKESLLLSRTRVLHDLETCLNPRYRVILERSLTHLDEKLAALG